MSYPFTSESVAIGHPDKVADQISDRILDACLAQDKTARVAVETLITTDLIVLAGEVTAKAKIDYAKIARDTVKTIGYTSNEIGFDPDNAEVLVKIHQQSPDIAQAVDQGAGDQGIVFGFAIHENDAYMPLPIYTASNIVRGLVDFRKNHPAIRPDGKTQVTVDYYDGKPVRIDTVVLSVQHDDTISNEELRSLFTPYLSSFLPLKDDKTKFLINPSGRFIIGGPQGDTGLTGRKIVVDTYGAYGRIGGGAFSGKDPSKIDRSAAYMARYLAKQIVASKQAYACEIEIAYAIGLKEPVSLRVNTFGSANDQKLIKTIRSNFDLSPRGIINYLDLERPIYSPTAFGGHFGHSEYPWEKLDKVSLFTG